MTRDKLDDKPRFIETTVDFFKDYTQEDMAASREAGRRAAMDRDKAFMDAFFAEATDEGDGESDSFAVVESDSGR